MYNTLMESMKKTNYTVYYIKNNYPFIGMSVLMCFIWILTIQIKMAWDAYDYSDLICFHHYLNGQEPTITVKYQ